MNDTSFIAKLSVRDIRFPTRLTNDGSDAINVSLANLYNSFEYKTIIIIGQSLGYVHLVLSLGTHDIE